MNFIPTYEEAKMICEYYNNFNFSETVHYVNGFKISTFSYFLATNDMFFNPIKDKPEINGINLRGISYVFNKDNTIYKVFLMLPKFFNINQTTYTQYDNVKDLKIKNITNKFDGSLISFIELPDKTIVPKTINSFDNIQCEYAKNLMHENKTYEYITNALENNYTPCFELISPSNRIVIKYDKTELKVLGKRDNKSGEWFPENNICINNSLSIDKLINDALSNDCIDKEGWVIQFDNGMLMKIKTLWYCNLHGIYTEDINREDKIIEMYINNKIDDLLNLTNDEYILNNIKKCCDSVDNFKIIIQNNIEKLNEIYLTMSRAEFCKNYKKNFYFSFFMLSINSSSKDFFNEKLNAYILKTTYRLYNAKDFVNNYSELVN